MTPHSEDQQLQVYAATPQASSCSLSSHVFTHSSIQDQGRYNHREVYQLLESQQQANNFASRRGSHDHSALEGDRDLKFSPWKKDGNENQRGDQDSNSAKWMPPKMRLMRKMMSSDQTVAETPTTAQLTMKFEDHQKPTSSPLENDNTSNNSCSNPVRVCADCNTTKTPLWRSGPKGPKSLCNACGIRQRKARRAMAAAAAAAAAAGGGNGTVVDEISSVLNTKKEMQHRDKRSNNGGGGRINAKYKKRSKLSKPSHGRNNYKSNCIEDLLINLSKNLAFHQVFPQDEKDAAILLMALSCGLICG